MIKIFVDSGSSIKEHEKNKYGVEIIPLKVMLDGKEYEDGIDLDYNEFYEYLQKGKKFTKMRIPPTADNESITYTSLLSSK